MSFMFIAEENFIVAMYQFSLSSQSLMDIIQTINRLINWKDSAQRKKYASPLTFEKVIHILGAEASREYKLKLFWDHILFQSEVLSPRNQFTTNTGKDVRKGTYTLLVGLSTGTVTMSITMEIIKKEHKCHRYGCILWIVQVMTPSPGAWLLSSQKQGSRAALAECYVARCCVV